MKKKRRFKALPNPTNCARLLLQIAPNQVGMFRFLLEGYGHLACFTVLDRREALLKLLFSPHQHVAVRAALESINSTVPIVLHDYPALSDSTPCTASNTDSGDIAFIHR